MRLNQSLLFSSPLASVSVSVSVSVPVPVSVSVSVSGVRAVFAVTDGGEQNDVVLRYFWMAIGLMFLQSGTCCAF